MENKKLLKVKDVAELLNASKAHVYYLVKTGALPAVRIGEQIRFDPEALEQWIKNGGAKKR